MRTRTRYLPIEDASAGMLLADAVRDPFLMPLLPAGSTLNADNLRQLQAHGVDFLCIAVPDERSDADIAAQTEEATRCVSGIFASADLTEPVMAALFKQVLRYRST